jgi:transposase-like protein
MITASLVALGRCKQVEIVKAFNVSRNSVSRSVLKYRKHGPAAFFKIRKGHGGTVLTDTVKAKAQDLLNHGNSTSAVADELGIKSDTLRKAISQGRLSVSSQTVSMIASSKSERSEKDSFAGMGIACTRQEERVAAAMGLLPGGADANFETCLDVPMGGVLCGIPALISNGLLRHIGDCFSKLFGYYTELHVLLLMAYMALGRIKTVDQLQGYAPGELGKLMGLDRVPEVRCLRSKLAELSKDNAPEKWSALLSKDWMDATPELTGALYVDGHVRVYHGAKTKLPKRFISRQRLCLRGNTDYWVNDALGQPFFVVNRAVDQGMLEALRTDIVPRLLLDIPNQPTDEALKADPFLSRFTLIFDREGYSPGFFKEMWDNHRVACITYHKFPKEDWPEKRFKEVEVNMPNGELLTMKLAEMGSLVGSSKSDQIWLREIRKLNKCGHQSTLISSAKDNTSTRDAALLFSRWSQENFFGYMMKHYAIDLLSEYGTEDFPGTQQIVNPEWRRLKGELRSLQGKLATRNAKYATLVLHPEQNDRKMERWIAEKAQTVEEIEYYEYLIEELKLKIRETPEHLDWHELPETKKFKRLSPGRKRLTDTIKMIAYRAETAMANIVREKFARKDNARTLLVRIFQTDADILPDIDSGTLTVRLHQMSSQRENEAAMHLLKHLNETESNYPGTKLRLIYEMISARKRDPD